LNRVVRIGLVLAAVLGLISVTPSAAAAADDPTTIGPPGMVLGGPLSSKEITDYGVVVRHWQKSQPAARSAAEAASPGLAAATYTTGYCDSIKDGWYQAIARELSANAGSGGSGADFTGVIGQTHGGGPGSDQGLQQLLPCHLLSGQAMSAGFAAIIPVTLQEYHHCSACQAGIVQIAINRYPDYSGLTFCYTLNDVSGGSCRTWPGYLHPTPRDSYEFTIFNYKDASGWHWYYEIWDMTSGYADATSTPMHWVNVSAQVAWYGFESKNVKSVLGVVTGTTANVVGPTWARRFGSSSFLANTNFNSVLNKYASDGTWPSWEHLYAARWTSGYDALYATTDPGH
jgi:hypothetical protein